MKKLEEVRLDALTGEYKFIQVRDSLENVYIRGTPEWDGHHQIMAVLKKEAKELGFGEKLFCEGGGWLKFDDEKKTAIAYRWSGDYGRFEPEAVREPMAKYLEAHGYELTRCQPGKI